MNTHFVPPGTDRADSARVLILGEPGVGKTRLAATFPDPLFIDIEIDGSASALPSAPARIVVPMTSNTLKDTVNVLREIKKGRKEKGLYEYQGVPIRTVIIDPIDQIQRSVQTGILKGRDVMQMRDWGMLLERMYPLVLEWSGLSCYVVVVGHVKRRSDDDSRGMPEAMLAVKGSLREELPGWFSIIMHVISAEEGKRRVGVQPMVWRGTKYVAKDRHDVLKGLIRGKDPWIDITSDTGWPSNKIARTICGESNDRPEKDA